MKKFVILLFVCSFAKAQDTIRFRNGEVQAVKVNEVGVSDIKYNRFDNVSGPQYVVDKNDIRSIKYSGGFIDSFAIVKPPVKVTEFKTVNSIVGADKIEVVGYKLFYRGKGLGESRLLRMAEACPDEAKRNVMMKTYNEMRSYKKKQYAFGFALGLGGGIGAPYVGALASLFSNDVTTFAAGIVLGAGLGITGAVLSGINKKNRLNKKVELARIYNN